MVIVHHHKVDYHKVDYHKVEYLKVECSRDLQLHHKEKIV
jgi:hypothetical protein